MALAWGASAIAVYAVSSGRVFDSASIDAVPRRRAAVVLGYAAKDVNGRYSIKTTIREQLAKIAAVADVVLHRRPAHRHRLRLQARPRPQVALYA